MYGFVRERYILLNPFWIDTGFNKGLGWCSSYFFIFIFVVLPFSFLCVLGLAFLFSITCTHTCVCVCKRESVHTHACMCNLAFDALVYNLCMLVHFI